MNAPNTAPPAFASAAPALFAFLEDINARLLLKYPQSRPALNIAWQAKGSWPTQYLSLFAHDKPDWDLLSEFVREANHADYRINVFVANPPTLQPQCTLVQIKADLKHYGGGRSTLDAFPYKPLPPHNQDPEQRAEQTIRHASAVSDGHACMMYAFVALACVLGADVIDIQDLTVGFVVSDSSKVTLDCRSAWRRSSDIWTSTNIPQCSRCWQPPETSTRHGTIRGTMSILISLR
jgi:hypothetical protein